MLRPGLSALRSWVCVASGSPLLQRKWILEAGGENRGVFYVIFLRSRLSGCPGVLLCPNKCTKTGEAADGGIPGKQNKRQRRVLRNPACPLMERCANGSEILARTVFAKGKRKDTAAGCTGPAPLTSGLVVKRVLKTYKTFQSPTWEWEHPRFPLKMP